MQKNIIFWIGNLGVLLFVFTTVIAGFFNPSYNHFSCFISELYAVDAPNADLIRFYGYLPSGVFFILFALLAQKATPKSRLKSMGFLGMILGYGFGTIICAIYNCDTGCNPKFINPSLSQIIHNLMGMLTYLIVPFSILLIAIASRSWKNSFQYTLISYIIFGISFTFVVVLNLNLDSQYKGLIQRIIEGSILFWIVYGEFYFSNKSYQQI
ncbi:DUF998 domain-containing protein [Flavobacterium franklandianum]|uniref:DUF998 domain-containing protein n=1 Tax=Flavobacterium franklandianum TaxID=2594430 RepID=A0A553C7M8_9FLAO|nr:DUF998 domain-containing protein [Flavobacterium franklandianum]TRX16422.1 DUF998 domain-containing protein [Flavobacterium franklandianum]